MRRGASEFNALFAAALELDGDARDAWLAELRDREPQTAARIERLLALDREGADPFASAIHSIRRDIDEEADDLIDQDIAGFRILRVLGRGGMGVVYLAERRLRDFQQWVALKLLHGQWLDPATLDRFARERRILARLHHPNIATLIDAGATADGRPYLVMEYIEGEPLADYCDNRKLDLGARMQLARGLLSALAYAHRALVVHRDLKPGNVLVTADGTLKLLDFGIARLLEADTGAPRNTATRVFTPDYASPEQLAGEAAGTGSDIYSFGLILHELCVGVLPWEIGARPLSGAVEMATPTHRFRQRATTRCANLTARRAIAPQALARRLRGDLGLVLARCLHVDPAWRYATVQALDDDLCALLDRRPPPGVQVPRRQRVLAFTRRHAWPLAAASLLLCAGFAILVQSVLAGQRLATERDRALAAAEQARREAEKSTRVAGFVQAMLSSVNPDQARGLDRTLMRLVLDSAAERAEQELAAQPDVRSTIERTIAGAYNSIGEYPLAVEHFEAALKASRDGLDRVADNVAVRSFLARSLGNAGRPRDALAAAQAAVTEAAGLPEDSRERLFAESSLAGLQCDLGEFENCRVGYRRVFDLQRRSLGEHDEQTLYSMQGLAYADSYLGRHEEAQELYRELSAHFARTLGETHSRTLDARYGMAVDLLRAKRFVEGERILTPLLATAEKTLGAEHPTTISILSALGGSIRQQPGRNAEARPYYERVFDMVRRQFGADTLRSAISEINLATLLGEAGELDAAETHARSALKHGREAIGADSPRLSYMMRTTASVLIRRGRYAEAEKLLDENRAILAGAEGIDASHPLRQDLAREYINLYRAMERPDLERKWQAELTDDGGGDPAAP
jgi:serine/threonine protein kinase/tetratricopeptide (TPR) repeat protein